VSYKGLVDACYFTSDLDPNYVRTHNLLAHTLCEPTPPKHQSQVNDSDLDDWADLPLFCVEQDPCTQTRPTRFCNISSASWISWVLEQRQRYSARLKSTPRVSVSAFFSSQSEQIGTDELARPWRSPTAQESGKGSKGDLTDKNGEPWTGEGSAYFNGQVAQITLDQQVYADARATSAWPTPNTSDSFNPNIPHDIGRSYLQTEVIDLKQWGTPRLSIANSPSGTQDNQKARLENQIFWGQHLTSDSQTHIGLLNPRWVECLMGLPLGWTKP